MEARHSPAFRSASEKERKMHQNKFFIMGAGGSGAA